MKPYQSYKITEASQTTQGEPLASGFIVALTDYRVKDDQLDYSFVTCTAEGQPPLLNNEEKLSSKPLSFPFDPEKDKAKTMNKMMVDTFEKRLKEEFGNNWEKI